MKNLNTTGNKIMKHKKLTLALALACSQPYAATITVSPDCSLVDAILSANTNTAVGGCPAGDDQNNGRDVIELTGNVTLSEIYEESEEDGPNGLPAIESAITINGNEYTIARAREPGIPNLRIMQISPKGDLELNNITLTGGSLGTDPVYPGGAGLSNQGKAMLSHSRIVENVAKGAGGILNDGTLTINDSEFSNNVSDNSAGALWNNGSASINRSTIRGSRGPEEAINNHGELLITDSLITETWSWNGNGPAILNEDTLTLINSTISNNMSGLFLLGKDSMIIHSTIANNGQGDEGASGLSSFGDENITLINSIFFGNPKGDCRGTVTFEGVNFIGDGSCGAAENNQLTGDARLEELADNGGPTWTHALLPGSPAIDAVGFIEGEGCEPTDVLTDQRGIERPQGQGCDIGAFEHIDDAITFQDILSAFDTYVESGEIQGRGLPRFKPGKVKLARKHLQSLRNENMACMRIPRVVASLRRLTHGEGTDNVVSKIMSLCEQNCE